MILNGLDILLTYECTGRCAHCCYRAGPGRGGTMTLAEVRGYLEAVADQPLDGGILLFGGEPFLCYDLLRDSIPLAAQLSRVYIFTNGYWATDARTARQRLRGLQEVGLDYILFSVDAFHQAHVPLERIATGIEAARELGYGTIAVDNCSLQQPEMDNFFNRRTRENVARLAQMCDLSGVEIDAGPARVVGRAVDQLSPFLPRGDVPPTECPLPDYLGGDLRAPTGVEIHPGGWVDLCAGLALGNARERPLGQILAGYDPDAHPIIGVLAREGPLGLMRLAERHGFSLAGGYVDGCHLCYEARRSLRPHYPEFLSPAQPYTERIHTGVLPLQAGIIYGPIRSRRLGRSLGVNLLPTGYKLCSFDCVYCHYGRTAVRALRPGATHLRDFPGKEDVLRAVEEALRTCSAIDYLTFSGNGEPTLHPDFPAIARAVRRLRDRLRPGVKLAILSNSTTVHLPHVREAMELFDAPVMKLDAGDAETFARINRPAPAVELPAIIEGLKKVPGLVIQSVLIDGGDDERGGISNVRGGPFRAWLAALGEIKPGRVQIYSTDRPVPEAGVEAVPSSTLGRIAREIERRAGLDVTAYWA